MTPDPAPARPLIPSEPLILLANGDQVFRDTIETVLVASGFRVIQVDNGPRTLEQARRHQPDGVLLDITFSPQWPDAYAVCRALRAPPDPIISPAVPLILTTAGPVLRAQQLEALRQGAWELRGDPLDMEELSLRLAAYVQGKLESDRVRGEGLLDRASGLYNASGVARRAEELAAYAARQGVALGCAMFAPAAPLEEPDAADRLAAAFRRVGRMSDAIGRTGPAEFTVFAPATDAQGVAGLVARMRAGVSELFGTGNGHSFALRAGASAEPASKRMSPRDLWSRARRALDGEAGGAGAAR